MLRALLLLGPLWGQSDGTHFETKVRPVLVQACQPCHGVAQQFGKLRVDSREALLRGGSRGPAVVPGKPEASLLWKALRHEGDLRMPQGGKLKESEIQAIGAWIAGGAVWPVTQAPARTVSMEDHYRRLARTHWAFQKVQAPPVADVDAVLEARLRKEGLGFAKTADRRVLLRRLSYVLTGLPPAPNEVERFVADRSPQAYERQVERLLGSPQFGEHWARHWLDVMRFGETRGYEWNYEILGAWRYRDYLIRAFNADVPYDQLIREHVAGDLLAKPRINAREQINESVIGTAFFRLGEAGHDDCIQFREIATDVIDNQIDTLTKAFQGLTVSCARCHDHKLDPIPTTDYYALYGILNSSHHVTHSVDTGDVNRSAVERLRGIKQQLRSTLAAQWMTELPRLLPAALAARSKGMEEPGALFQAAQSEEWSAVRARYQKEAAERAAFNQANFTELPLSEWQAAGMGLRQQRTGDGEFAIQADGDPIVTGIYPSGYYTHLDSTRLNGALRLAQLPAGKKFLSLLVNGGMLGSHRTVVDNCAIGEGYKLLDAAGLNWQKTALKDTRLPVFPELLTRFDNPRIPDRPGVIKKEQLHLLNVPRSWFGLARAVVHDVDESPRAELQHLTPLLGEARPGMEQFVAVARMAIERWAAGQATAQDVAWLDWLLRSGAVANAPGAAEPSRKLVAEYREVEAALAEPRVVEGLADMGIGRDFPVFQSGQPANPGAAAPRVFLRHLIGGEAYAGNGSGRLMVAERIADAGNPLTSRVMVNRIWQHVFGRGLVPTTDNFGILAERPSHPELLDGLAAKFVADGWSVKKMVRLLVMTRAFQQGNETTARARELDPLNAWLHHYAPRRLTAEALRDSILAASGRLELRMYGPSVDPYRDKPQDYRRLFSGPLDGDGRRSLYLKVTRMEGARFLETFDYPNPMAARGTRDVTNVPAQALTMLNDPFVTGQAGELAKRVVASGSEFDGRLTELFRLALGRKPDAGERARFSGLAGELGSLLGKPRESAEVWGQLAHAAFNLKEFLYIQ